VPYFVYILRSESLGRYYTGFSCDHWKRQRQHRSRHKGWTGQAADWQEVFCIQVATIREARALEKQIKARGAGRFLSERAVSPRV
jgi:putative endonuclease